MSEPWERETVRLSDERVALLAEQFANKTEPNYLNWGHLWLDYTEDGEDDYLKFSDVNALAIEVIESRRSPQGGRRETE